jgi:hypothetical protein
VDLKRRLQRVAASFNARARQHHAPGIVTWQNLAVMGDRCHYCGISLLLDQGTWDHKISFNDGGDNWPSNIVRCCTSCQRTKFTKNPAEFEAHKELRVTCPIDGTIFQPRWAEYQRGVARYCSLRCAGAAGARKREENRWASRTDSGS